MLLGIDPSWLCVNQALYALFYLSSPYFWILLGDISHHYSILISEHWPLIFGPTTNIKVSTGILFVYLMGYTQQNSRPTSDQYLEVSTGSYPGTMWCRKSNLGPPTCKTYSPTIWHCMTFLCEFWALFQFA